MEINLQNIEQQILFDKKIYSLLPEFRHFFDQWKLSKTYPGFGNLGRRTLLDLLNSFESKHISILEEYFGCSVFVNKIDPNLIKNYQSELDSVNLCEFSGYKEFCVFRNKDTIKVTFWR